MGFDNILTTNVRDIKEPGARWTHLKPDVKMKQYSPVPSGLPDMWLLHTDNIHFDLIVHIESTLVTEGSLESNKSDKACEKGGMNVHIEKSHEEGVLVECKQCDNIFETEEGLKEHISVKHIDERKIQCKQCERRFKTEDGLKRHTKNMHEETYENSGPGYMGWKIDDEVEDMDKDKYI